MWSPYTVSGVTELLLSFDDILFSVTPVRSQCAAVRLKVNFTKPNVMVSGKDDTCLLKRNESNQIITSHKYFALLFSNWSSFRFERKVVLKLLSTS